VLSFKLTVPQGAEVVLLLVEDATLDQAALATKVTSINPTVIEGDIAFTGVTHILDIMLRAVGRPGLAITFNFSTKDTPAKPVYPKDQELLISRGGRGIFLDTKAVYPS
jgi:hypothetical protein